MSSSLLAMGSIGSLLASHELVIYTGHGENVRAVKRLTRKEVSIAVRFILSPLLTVGHCGHLLGRGASHLLLLLLRTSPPHS